MSKIKDEIDYFILSYFYKQLHRTINKRTQDCTSLLDLGCGYNPGMKPITSRMEYSLGLDVFEPSLTKAKKAHTHHDFKQVDVLEYLEQIPDKSFDAVIALDLIEHLKKEKGYWFMEQMERIARKKVIIFTPNGFVPQRPYDNNPWQEHLSGWSWDEMQAHGFELHGFGGYKKLRGERFSLRYKPRIFWKYISFMTQLYTFKHPELAFGILCTKNLTQAK